MQSILQSVVLISLEMREYRRFSDRHLLGWLKAIPAQVCTTIRSWNVYNLETFHEQWRCCPVVKGYQFVNKEGASSRAQPAV